MNEETINYVVIELQTANGTTIPVTPVFSTSDLNEALSRFHSICAVAALSTVPFHAVSLLNHHGQLIQYEEFIHEEASDGQ